MFVSWRWSLPFLVFNLCLLILIIIYYLVTEHVKYHQFMNRFRHELNIGGVGFFFFWSKRSGLIVYIFVWIDTNPINLNIEHDKLTFRKLKSCPYLEILNLIWLVILFVLRCNKKKVFFFLGTSALGRCCWSTEWLGCSGDLMNLLLCGRCIFGRFGWIACDVDWLKGGCDRLPVKRMVVLVWFGLVGWDKRKLNLVPTFSYWGRYPLTSPNHKIYFIYIIKIL